MLIAICKHIFGGSSGRFKYNTHNTNKYNLYDIPPDKIGFVAASFASVVVDATVEGSKKKLDDLYGKVELNHTLSLAMH